MPCDVSEPRQFRVACAAAVVYLLIEVDCQGCQSVRCSIETTVGVTLSGNQKADQPAPVLVRPISPAIIIDVPGTTGAQHAHEHPKPGHKPLPANRRRLVTFRLWLNEQSWNVFADTVEETGQRIAELVLAWSRMRRGGGMLRRQDWGGQS